MQTLQRNVTWFKSCISFAFQDVAAALFVFLRHEEPKAPLKPPYEDPFPAILHSTKTFVSDINCKSVTVYQTTEGSVYYGRHRKS